jgi:glycine betaine catabolism B
MGEDFVKVTESKNIQASQMMAVEVNGEKVCLSNVRGKYYAIGNVYIPIWEVLLQKENLKSI